MITTLIGAMDVVQADDLVKNQRSLITPEDVAVVVNDQDKNSVEIGNYYLNARNIPRKNLIIVSIKPNEGTIYSEEFSELREKIYASLGSNIQAIALLWTAPYAVSCNSITSAMTLGFEPEQCKNGCGVGKKNPYFNSTSLKPFQDHHIRLSMLLPTDDVTLAKSIIDKGVLSSFRLNDATGYFLKTQDSARSKPREPFFPRDLTKVESKKLFIRTIKADSIRDKKDVMFYFTGMEQVPFLDTLNFMPGAIADHLTSAGGILYKPSQMTGLSWLAAGVTGTYGTVTEPCNYWQKFPNPRIVLQHYLAGETLIESYWKSVYWPTQGLFMGEPLAAPY